MSAALDVDLIRQQFPALARRVNGFPVAMFDGPAGSQVPLRVAEAVRQYLLETNANHGGAFATAVESDAILDDAHRAVADFVAADDSDCICFGPNMTTLTFGVSRALAAEWREGDEIIVTRLDHDANVTPWVLAARDAGVTVRYVDFRHEDCTLDLPQFDSLLSSKTRLVAVGYASNATGTINPVSQIAEMAHAVGAEVFVDAVHFAPHRLIDVGELGCDYLAVSAYKFFGPHIGMLWGRRDRLETLAAYKVRPAPDSLPGKWMTGTQNHEGIAGVAEAVDYLAEIGRSLPASSGEVTDRRTALGTAFAAIRRHEESLLVRLLDGLEALPKFRVWGITDRDRWSQRVPTISVTHADHSTRSIAEFLAERGIAVWAGNHYALQFTEAAGLEPGGTLRIGILHYNTAEEIDRLLEALNEIDKSGA